ncbi:MAG TPA: serine hydrolase, partial [Steroidobacteraceae bacterium]|nr:serine hydrolase [Steroidobacteraceae bacterium]
MRREIAGVLWALSLLAGTSEAAPPESNLGDYVGTYLDQPGRIFEIVAGDELFAVQDEAKYRLQPSGVDEFVNAGGEKVSFRRSPTGQVLGFTVEGEFHARQSTEVTAASAALARPRPPGEDRPADYQYHAPADLHDGIPVGDIAKSDVDSALAATIVRRVLDGTYRDVHGVLLYQHGRLVMEEYFYGYGIGRPHQLRSATKSVVSVLAGIAVDAGAIPGVGARVLPSMKYTSYANPDPRKAAMTLGHFLSMSSGLDCNDHSSTSPGRETVVDNAPDWVKATLDLPMINNPGSSGLYCSGGVAVVGRMVENATHMYLPDFAQARLFGPLGIARTDWIWDYTLTNADKQYSQIYLRPRDMLKLGILFLDGGRWRGRRVISADWVRASLSDQSRVDDTAYGYFWWRPWLNVEMPGGAQHVDLNAAQGNGGQKIYVVPQYDLVAVFTGGDYNSAGSPPNKIMATIILPALISA